MGFVAEGGDRALLGKVGREYLKVLGAIKIEDFRDSIGRAVEKLAGYNQARGRLREIMSSVEYPEGFFYVERTLVLLFGLVGPARPTRGFAGVWLCRTHRGYSRWRWRRRQEARTDRRRRRHDAAARAACRRARSRSGRRRRMRRPSARGASAKAALAPGCHYEARWPTRSG